MLERVLQASAAISPTASDRGAGYRRDIGARQNETAIELRERLVHLQGCLHSGLVPKTEPDDAMLEAIPVSVQARERAERTALEALKPQKIRLLLFVPY